MSQTLKNHFMQTFTLTTVWVTLLLSLFSHQNVFGFSFIWRILGIALISALLFGILYNLLWHYLTLPASANILISATLNIAGGLSAIWLLSPMMFNRILPWTFAMLVLSIIGHIIGFYVYAKQQNDREIAHLNHLLK